MRRYRRYLFFSLLVWARVAAAGQGVLLDKVVAVVNDEVITLSELQKEEKPLVRRIREELEGEAQASQMQITQRQVLRALILRRLQLQEAEKEGIVVDKTEIDTTVEMIKERNGFASEEELVGALAKDDLTLDEFKSKIQEQMVVDRLLARHVRTRIVVSEEEITKYYQAHMDQFDQDPSVRLRHVLIRLPDEPSPEEVTQARTRSWEALAKLRNGAKFEEVAAQYSDGPTAQAGGDLGVIRKGELDPALERAAFALEPGMVSDVIQTAAGLNIIRVEERTTGDVPIDAIRARVRQRLFQEKMQKRMEAYFTELTKKAYIDVRLDQ